MAGSIAENSTGLRRDTRVRRPQQSINRKIWLPKLVYDALPWFYTGAGLLALLATLYIGESLWRAPHSIIAAAVCMHLATYVFIRRYRRRDDD